MSRRTERVLLLILLLVSTLACQRAKPQRAVAPVPLQAAARLVHLELDAPPGQSLYRVEGQPRVIIQDNCTGDKALERAVPQSAEFPKSYRLDLRPDPARGADESGQRGQFDLVPYASSIDEIISRRYGLPPVLQAKGLLTVQVRAGARAQIVLRWDEIWDQNTLSVIREGQVVASAPLRVGMEATLVQVSSHEEPCAGGRVATVGTLAAATPVRGSGASPTGTTTAGFQPASDKAMALVRDYIRALGDRDWRQAYALLDASYRGKAPYDAFVRAYEPLTRIEVHVMEAEQVSEQIEMVRVGMTLTTEQRGRSSASDWWCSYKIVPSPDTPPYQRRIGNVQMERMGSLTP